MPQGDALRPGSAHNSSARPAAATARDHGRRGQARRRLAADRLAGRQLARVRRRGHARAGPHGDARAELSPEPGRAGAGDRPDEDARRHQHRLGRVRAGLDPARTRARRPRARLLREHRPARLARPRVADAGARAAATSERRGHPHQRGTGEDHPGARPSRDGRAGRRGRGHPGGRGARRRGRSGGGCGRSDAAAARSRPSHRVAHRRSERLVGGAATGRGMARDAGVGRGAGAASALRRLEPAIGL